MSRYDFSKVCNFLISYTAVVNLAVWALAIAGMNLWPNMLVWAWFISVLWVLFIGGPLAALAWVMGREDETAAWHRQVQEWCDSCEGIEL